MASHELRRIAGALSAFWQGGAGPPRSAIVRAFVIGGHDREGLQDGNKEELVLNVISQADDPVARTMIEELVGVLRNAQVLEADAAEPLVAQLRRILEATGHTLTKDGSIIWASGPRIPKRIAAVQQTQPTAASPAAAPASPAAAPETTQVSSRAAASYAQAEICMPTNPRATLFIGSTIEALEVARAVHAELDHDLDVTIWNHGLFSAGVTTWSQLTSSIVRNYDFALFIFSGDDVVRSRNEQSPAIRDNLLIEYGLFVGVLGPERTLFLYNRDHRPKVASDLGGVTALTYRDRDDNNLQAAVSPACGGIRQVVTKLGRASRSNP